jgi:hypothetical protein
VYHATDRTGRPLVLVRDGDDLDAALPHHDLRGGPATILAVDDVPPLDRAPSLGQVQVHGHIRRLAPGEAALAVHPFAEANPVGDLLDVGVDASMCIVEPDRVRLDHHHASVEIDLADYTAAVPDPLHELERDLLVDLADHHATQIESYLRCLLALTGRPCRTAPRAVRLDRYGFVVDVGDQGSGPEDGGWVRVRFARPVHCRHDLAHLLHPVLFPTCPDPEG